MSLLTWSDACLELPFLSMLELVLSVSGKCSVHSEHSFLLHSLECGKNEIMNTDFFVCYQSNLKDATSLLGDIIKRSALLQDSLYGELKGHFVRLHSVFQSKSYELERFVDRQRRSIFVEEPLLLAPTNDSDRPCNSDILQQALKSDKKIEDFFFKSPKDNKKNCLTSVTTTSNFIKTLLQFCLQQQSDEIEVNTSLHRYFDELCGLDTTSHVVTNVFRALFSQYQRNISNDLSQEAILQVSKFNSLCICNHFIHVNISYCK